MLRQQQIGRRRIRRIYALPAPPLT
jgi:hypothetical protein